MSHEHRTEHELHHEHRHMHAEEQSHHHEEFDVHPCDGEGHEHHHHEDGTCCCEQHAREFHGIEKPMLIRLILAAVCYLTCEIFDVSESIELVLMLCCAVLAGCDVVFGAAKNLAKGHFFDEYFLMSFAAIAAFAIREYEEGAAVFLLYRIGAFCQSYAIRHSRKKIVNLTGEEDYEEEARLHTPFITRFAKIYTPVILGLAVLIAVGMPVVSKASFHDSVYRALSFLVLACPCAIVISVPLTYFSGISSAAGNGVFFHSSEALDAAACADPDHVTIRPTRAENGMNIFTCVTDAENNKSFLMQKEDELRTALNIAKKTKRIAAENVWFTIGIKAAVLILSVCGISSLWFAVFADSGVTVLVVLNSLRAFRANGTF